MNVNFISLKDNDDKQLEYYKNDRIKIMIDKKT